MNPPQCWIGQSIHSIYRGRNYVVQLLVIIVIGNIVGGVFVKNNSLICNRSKALREF